MRFIPFLSAALATVVIAADDPVDTTGIPGIKVLPRLEATQPKDGAKRTTIPYGSYMVSSSRMLQTTKLAKGPCPTGGCYVTAMQANLRYPDGKEANIDSNAWLHHIAMFGTGGGSGSLWAAGNERPTLRLNVDQKYGLDFPAAYMLMIDLMTEETKAKNLTLEVTFEWVPKNTPGYKAAAMNWLTIGEPAAKEGVYSFRTSAQSSGYNGKLLYAIGHMHDGGTDMRLFVNNKLVCKSIMHYNERPGYTPPGAQQGAIPAAQGKGANRFDIQDGGHGAMAHISDPGACVNFGDIKRGDSMRAEAWYDATKYPLMVHNGKKESLMGNMRVYVGPN